MHVFGQVFGLKEDAKEGGEEIRRKVKMKIELKTLLDLYVHSSFPNTPKLLNMEVLWLKWLLFFHQTF